MGFNVDESVCLNTNSTCMFALINGSCITIICVAGSLLSAFTIYCLIFHVRLPYHQNMFILNVAVSDLTIALLGTVRGMGIINPILVGYSKDTGTTHGWCYAYTLAGNTLWMCPALVLLPLTIDRFVALVIPMKYKSIITTRNSIIMIALTWIALIPVFIYDMTTLKTKGIEILIYQKNYHRCVIQTNRSWKKILYAIIPYIAIVFMYTTMLFFVHRAKLESRKLMVVSLLIITSGLLAHIPDQLLITFKVNMSYEVAQIATVTLWYTPSVWNPIIYFCSNAITRRNLAATRVGKRVSDASSVIVNQARRMSLYTTTKENDVVNEMDSVNEMESLDDIQDVDGKGDSDSRIAVD